MYSGRIKLMEQLCAQCDWKHPYMKRCSRCRAVFYCSVECQTKHWSIHKSTCVRSDKKASSSKGTRVLICDHCNKEGLDLKQCLGCKDVYYCTKICQKEAWAIHKDKCNKVKDRLKPTIFSDFQNLFRNCTFCGKIIENMFSTRSCPHCLKGVYCTKYCLANDWSKHKLICEQSTSGPSNETMNQPGGDLKTDKVCKTCGKGENIKSCSTCKRIYYCSKICQKNDWKNHKINCTKTTPLSNKLLEKVELEKKLRDMRIQDMKMDTEFQRSKRYKYKTTFGNFDSEALLYDDHADVTVVKRPSPVSWERMSQKAFSEYPGFTILTSMSNVPHERSKVTKPTLLVAFIPRYHHYRGRHCVYVEDATETELYVAFYFKSQQFPEFQWSNIKPGRFIFIKHPRIHYFGDSSVGFRLENPNEFELVDG